MTALTARHPNYYVLDGCLGSLFKDNKNPGNSTVTRVLSGDGGNRTRVRQSTPRSSPGAVCSFISRPSASRRQATDGLSQLSVGSRPLNMAKPQWLPKRRQETRVKANPRLTDLKVLLLY